MNKRYFVFGRRKISGFWNYDRNSLLNDRVI